jgi:uncharacterized protein (DUF1800 family)
VIFGSSLDDSASFEDPFAVARTDADAVRFLAQATFGARAQDIGPVRSGTIAGWLEAQFDQPPTLSRQFLEAYAASLTTGSVSQDDRVNRWFDVAVNAPDQVRQKVAYALSQMVVISDRDAFLINEPIMMAEWNDILVRGALGNYRDLIRATTLSPMMGRYLTTLRNRKFELVRQTSAACSPSPFCYTIGNNGTQPDENYAREIMQLFTIGLVVRNANFTTVDDPTEPGVQPWETYDEETISTLARVFTGLSHGCTGNRVVGGVAINRNCAPTAACTGITCRFNNGAALFGNDPPTDPNANDRGLLHPDWYEPMVCYPRYHDIGLDTSGNPLPDPLNPPEGTTLPAGSPAETKALRVNGVGPLNLLSARTGVSPLNCHQTQVNNGAPDNATSLSPTEQQQCIQYCDDSLTAAVDLLFNHPNTAGMVARNLIQRLVTSNPSPAFIERVTRVFENNGQGVRGDLRAVVRATLLDVDARRPTGHPQQPVNFGKPREPIMKLVAIWRALDARSGDTAVFAGGPLAGQPSRRRWGPTNPQDTYAQRPLGAPSVFNFYEPDYQQPGQIAATGLDGQPSSTGLFSPEFQIINEVSGTTTANDLFARVCSGYGGGSNNCSGAFALPTDRGYIPPAIVDALPNDPVVLIEYLNTRLLGGAMSGTTNINGACPNKGTGMKGILLRAYSCPPAAGEPAIAGITGGTPQDQHRRRFLYLLHLVAISPEFAVQR